MHLLDAAGHGVPQLRKACCLDIRTTMMWVGPTSTLYQKGDVELADFQGVGYR